VGDVPAVLASADSLFAVIRAVATSIAAAIAFGLHLPNADWMPIATLIAMKPSLHDSALAAEQRLAGAILGAAVAVIRSRVVPAQARPRSPGGAAGTLRSL